MLTISQRSQCPLHSNGYCDFAQYHSRQYPPEPKRRHSWSSNRRHSPRAQPKLRHSARSRGIHLCLPTHQPEKPVPSALQYGYCDFAQYDGVGRARASLSSGTLLPSFPVVIQTHSNPNAVILVVPRTQTPSFPAVPKNFVIPRAVAESIFACQRINQRNRRPRRSNRDAATSRSMTVQGLTPHSRSSENRKPKLATECLYLYIGIF